MTPEEFVEFCREVASSGMRANIQYQEMCKALRTVPETGGQSDDGG